MTIDKLIIGLVGHKRAGKDTVYGMIHYISFFWAERVAFADPLKQEVAEACGVTVEEVERDKERFRPGLQWWGTEFRRARDADYWVKKAAAIIQHSEAPIIVVTDCRFPNEADFIRSLGGIIVKVIRPSVSDADSHTAEQFAATCEADFVIMNDGSTGQLLDKVDLLLGEKIRCAASKMCERVHEVPIPGLTGKSPEQAREFAKRFYEASPEEVAAYRAILGEQAHAGFKKAFRDELAKFAATDGMTGDFK